MFTDMVGFTSKAQRDEVGAMGLLGEQNRLVRSVIQAHGGREVKTMGDAFLVEFPSALAALNCAVKIQEEARMRNAKSPADARLELRVGLHLGDVIPSTGDIFGDAVNISSRIEPLAEPGGVCISEQIYDQVRNKTKLQLVKLETGRLKNVSSPIEVYKVVMPWEVETLQRNTELDRRRIAVLPLRNMSADPNDEYFADGMTEELITTLAGIRQLTVIARTSVMPYKAGMKRVADIGRELGVGTLIEGSVRKASNKVRITIQLIDVRNEGHLWAQNYDKQLDDIFAVQSEIAKKVAEKLKVRLLESERQSLEESPTKDVEAYTMYLKGRYHWNVRSKEEIEKAIEYFQLAVEHDPGFALGYSGLADCYLVMGRNGQAEPGVAYPMAKEYVKKALELGEKLAEAHAALGSISLYHDYDYDKAETEFRRAIELKPSYSTAHQWYSHLLEAEGRFSEGLEQIKKAVELDPFSRVINTNLVDALFWLGEYDKAVEQGKRVVALDSRYAAVWYSLLFTYIRMSAFDEALNAVDKYGELSGRPLDTKVARAYFYAAMGRADECRTLLDEVKRRFSEEILSPYLVAGPYFRLGLTGEGFEWLEKAYVEHDSWLVWMGVDEDLRSVRSDPRYVSLLDRIGLTKNLIRT